MDCVPCLCPSAFNPSDRTSAPFSSHPHLQNPQAASIALATFFTPEPHNGETGHQGDNDKVAAFSEQAGSTTTPCLLLSEGSGDGVLGLFQEPTPIAPVAAASSSSDSSGSSSSGGGEQQQEEEQTQGAKHTAPAFTEWMAPSLLATMQDTLGCVLLFIAYTNRCIASWTPPATSP